MSISDGSEIPRTLGLVVVFSGFFATAVWEVFAPRRASSAALSRRWLGNIGVYFLNGALLAWCVPTAATVDVYLETTFGLHSPRWTLGYEILAGLLVFIVLDAGRYWVHRLFHTVPALWRLHALHHADTEFDVSTALRTHPVEYLLAAFLMLAASTVIGVPAQIGALYYICAGGAACLQHGNIRLPDWLERVLAPVFVTPQMHRLHHSRVPTETNSNYGHLFSFWDRLFATYSQRTAEGHERLEFGLDEAREPRFQHLHMMLLLPWMLRRAGPEAAPTPAPQSQPG